MTPDFIIYCQILNNRKRLTFQNLLESNEFNNIILQWANIINSNNPRQILWHILNDVIAIPLCEECNTACCTWHSDNREYRSFCSGSCATKASCRKYKEKCVNKYGNNITHHTQLPQWTTKVKETCQRKYGVDHPSQKDEIKQLRKETCQKRYGGNAPAASSEVRDKIAKTCNKLYVESAIGYNKVIEKRKVTIFDRFGEDGLRHKAIANKRINTYQCKYDLSNPMHRHLSKETSVMISNPAYLEKYMEDKSVLIAAKNLGIGFSSLYQILKRFQITSFTRVLSSYQNEIKSLFDLQHISYLSCTRKIIPPKELDFYFPEMKIAIEFQGTYWHMDPRIYEIEDINQSNKKTAIEIWEADLYKKTLCEEQGIKLYHIWEIDWIERREEIINMLLQLLGQKNKSKEIISVNTVDYGV